jgi:hypothetical protein
MVKRILVSIALVCAVWTTTGYGQNKLALNVGGGISTPLNPTGAYTGISGNFNMGAGYALNKKNSITGEFMWSGLPGDLTAIHPVNTPTGSINLYSLTVNYRHHVDSIKGSPFGLYAIGGGGWYYRYASIDKSVAVAPVTPCLPIYAWWGYGCDPNADRRVQRTQRRWTQRRFWVHPSPVRFRLEVLHRGSLPLRFHVRHSHDPHPRHDGHSLQLIVVQKRKHAFVASTETNGVTS